MVSNKDEEHFIVENHEILEKINERIVQELIIKSNEREKEQEEQLIDVEHSFVDFTFLILRQKLEYFYKPDEEEGMTVFNHFYLSQLIVQL